VPARAFGVDFGTPTGGIGFFSFYSGNTLLHTAMRELSAGDGQFFGASFWDHSPRFDRIEVGVQGASAFTADNLTMTAPEPGTWVLMATGLCALAVIGRVARTRHER
jgi:hypothetical protein